MATHVPRKRLPQLSKEVQSGVHLSLDLNTTNGQGSNGNSKEKTYSTRFDQSKKAALMLEIYENRSFNNARSAQLLRLQLITWVIRKKIAQNIERMFDLVVASITLLLVWPLLLLVAIVIKLDSPGPFLFRQVRVGKHGKLFDCYKFRSMIVDAEARKGELVDLNEADEVVFKMKDDPRVTRVGRFIRKFSLDELPQIVNVLKGDMSLVGPRPPIPVEIEYYSFDQFQRLSVTPGITGLQQVSGRSDLEFKRWVELDLKYIEEKSLWKDVEILLKTIPAVLFGRGAY